jgi:hypothetical protein
MSVIVLGVPVTLTVKEAVPATVGVPVIRPEDDIDNPVGKAPTVIDQVSDPAQFMLVN